MSLEIFGRLGCARNGLGEMASSRISTTSGALLVSASDLSCLLEMGFLLLLLRLPFHKRTPVTRAWLLKGQKVVQRFKANGKL